jgi:transcriptional regulator with XRE-family HTH domain
VNDLTALDLDRRIRRAVGARLAQIRRERGLSQGELARALGTTPEVVSRYERGLYLPRPSVLFALRRHLAVTFDHLLAGTAMGEIADIRVRRLALAADALPPDHRTLLVTALAGLLEATRKDVERRAAAEAGER